MKYQWNMRPVERPGVVQRLQKELNNLPAALARALAVRGVETFDAARLFFRPSLENLHDPFLMQDMDVAADRVVQAVQRGERVLVYGDYDVDGTTATTLMTHFLRTAGAEVDFFIPDRLRDGYGLGTTGIDHAVACGASLIIALDCGITAHEPARYARECGLDLIICDHHTPEESYPEAVAVLNPKRADCAYPFKELCGCGVGFKLVQAVAQRLGYPDEHVLCYLDLVAVATASDIVPVDGENRVLLAEGLERLRSCGRLGFRKLAELGRLDLRDCTTSRVVFTIGPRINAAGRVGDAGRAVQLLLAEDEAEAAQMAQTLEAANEQRRALDRETLEQARHMAETQLQGKAQHSVVLYHPDWHLGVVGIVASRIVERYNKPTIMLAPNKDYVKGSARSASGVDLYAALQRCVDLLETFGGHKFAAGLALREENIPAFRQRFDEAVRDATADQVLLPEIEVDAPLHLDEIDRRFWAVLRQFAPHGPTNDTPIFHGRDLEVVGRPRTVGQGGRHLKFAVRQRDANGTPPQSVIGFGMGQHLGTLEAGQRQGQPLELLFSVEENTWNGRTTLQLRARDLRLTT